MAGLLFTMVISQPCVLVVCVSIRMDCWLERARRGSWQDNNMHGGNSHLAPTLP